MGDVGAAAAAAARIGGRAWTTLLGTVPLVEIARAHGEEPIDTDIHGPAGLVALRLRPYKSRVSHATGRTSA